MSSKLRSKKFLLLLIPFLILGLIFYLQNIKKPNTNEFVWKHDAVDSFSEEVFENSNGKVYSYLIDDQNLLEPKGFTVRDAKNGKKLLEKRIKFVSTQKQMFIGKNILVVFEQVKDGRKLIAYDNQGKVMWVKNANQIVEILGDGSNSLYTMRGQGHIDSTQYISKIDLQTGSNLWEVSVNGVISSSSVFEDENFIISTVTRESEDSENLIFYDSNGNKLWQITTDLNPSPIFIEDSFILYRIDGYSSSSREFLALDKETGKEFLRLSGSGFYNNGILYISNFLEDNKKYLLTAIDLQSKKQIGEFIIAINGNKEWTESIDTNIISGQVIVKGKEKLYSLSLKTLKENWSLGILSGSHVYANKKKLVIYRVATESYSESTKKYKSRLKLTTLDASGKKDNENEVSYKGFIRVVSGNDGLFLSTEKFIASLR